MKVTRGRDHCFLGMKFTINDNQTVSIRMKDYLVDAIQQSSLNVVKTAATPARKTLFDLDPLSPRLPKRLAEQFHSTVAKLLYVATRARIDLLLAISFLCTRV